MISAPIMRDVVLVGGGHSHALLLRRWAMRPLPGVRLTLVTRDVLTPYSGMLPGLVAGHYSEDEVHIDLLRLCAWAGVRFIQGDMTAIDPEAKALSISGRPPLSWDLLSLDTGSTPDLSVPGASDFATPVKPVAGFHVRWESIRDALQGDGKASLSLGVVGSGAGGFELVMAMRHALPDHRVQCHWFLRGDRPLSGRPEALGVRALAAAGRAGVVVHTGFDVTRVTAQGVESADARSILLDDIVWCTGANGPAWPAAAGLATDGRGFVQTDEYLRSTSHPDIFATGDVGTQRDTPSEKAGVFAVRQAPILHANLCATLLGESLVAYRPQRHFLSLMATGGRSAIASRGRWVFEGDALWRWKDWIDRRFMHRFVELPVMASSHAPSLLPDALLEGPLDEQVGQGMRCRGCGAKVGGNLLDEVLATLPIEARKDIMSGVAEGDDAAVIDWPGQRLVQSVDQLDAIVDDPWRFGRIATLHALSDVFASHAQPHSAQVMLTLPRGHPRVVRRELELVLGGIVSALNEADCALVGGHTAEGLGLTIGLVVNAVAVLPAARPVELSAARIEREAGAGENARTEATVERNGKTNVWTEASTEHAAGAREDAAVDDAALILTQPLGIGTLFAGLDARQARGVDIEAALREMERSNQRAAAILREYGAARMTDVTGFGLLGHLERMLRPDERRASIEVADVPVLAGAHALAEAGVCSTLWPASRQVLDLFDGVDAVPLAWQRLLCDPQTAGGLLAAVTKANAEACVNALRQAAYVRTAIVGSLERLPRHSLRFTSTSTGTTAS